MYAENTNVSVEKSRVEIESTLARYGADQFGYAHDVNRGLASIQFRANGRHVRFILKLPERFSDEFTKTPSKKRPRDESASFKAWEQACRQRWRALALCIKAKLEAVEREISVFEDEFMAHIVLPGDQTVSQLMRPQIEHAYNTGEAPQGIAGLLPAPEEDYASQ